MAKPNIQIPQTVLGSFRIPVRISDVNYGNHVGNDAFVSIIHEARLQWLKQHGFSEMNAGGTGLIMSHLSVEFKQQSYYGDIIHVTLYCGEASGVRFELIYSLSTERNNKQLVLANALTGMVCFDYETGKPAAMGEALKKLLHLD